MDEYGDATIARAADGRPVVERADPVIGVSLKLLAREADWLPFDGDGCLLLAGDPDYRYRPVRFSGTAGDRSETGRLLVCQRVP